MLNSYRLPECYIFNRSESVTMICDIINDSSVACEKIRSGIPTPWATVGLITMSSFEDCTFWQSRFRIKVFLYKVTYKHFVYMIFEFFLHKLADLRRNVSLQPLLIGMKINCKLSSGEGLFGKYIFTILNYSTQCKSSSSASSFGFQSFSEYLRSQRWYYTDVIVLRGENEIEFSRRLNNIVQTYPGEIII